MELEPAEHCKSRGNKMTRIVSVLLRRAQLFISNAHKTGHMTIATITELLI